MTERPASADQAARRLQAHADIREVVADRKRLVAELARADRAVELLHSLILRDLPNDGSEIPQPDNPWWAAQLDRIVTEAAAIYAAAIGSER